MDNLQEAYLSVYEAKVDDRLSSDQKAIIRNRRLSPGQRLPVRGETPSDTEQRLTQTRRDATASQRGARGVRGSKVPEFSGVKWQSPQKRSDRLSTLRAKSAKNNIRDFTREEVEEWINSLVEEGYDLSEYTWDDMCEIYMNEMVQYDLDEVRGGGRIDPVSNLPGHGERGSRSPEDAGMNMPPLDRAKARENALRKRGDTEATRRANRIKSRFVSPTERGVHRSINASNVAKTAERQRLRNQENQNEQFDLFDYLLEYLVAEGYADTNANAIAIMANMSEEWKTEILDEASPRISRSMGRRATQYRKDQEQAEFMERVRIHQEKMKNDPAYRESHMNSLKTHERKPDN